MSGNSTKTTNSSSSTTYPDWVTGTGQSLVQNLGLPNFNPYTGPTQASFGPTWGQSADFLSGQLGQTNPDTTAASGGFQSILNNLDPSKTTSDYVNPYVDATLQPTLRSINESYDRNAGSIGAGATMAGAFGGTGQGLEDALNERNRAQSIGDATNTAYSNAFTNAQGQQSTALSQIMQAAGGLSSTGQSAFGQGTTLASLLAGLGAQSQQAGQTGINTAISTNTSNQSGGLDLSSKLAQILAMLPKNVDQSGTSTTSQPDNSGLGFLGSVLGMGTGGGSTIAGSLFAGL